MKLISNYINGNHKVKLYSNGTKIKETLEPSATYFTYDFPENFDLKINDRCNGGCKYCHEGSIPSGKVPSLIELVESNLYKSLHAGTEVAIGGGNIFESPDIEDFLKANKEKGLVSNITVNQKHLPQNKETIKNWVGEKLVHGIGVSLTNSKELDVEGLGSHVVIHVINGILEPKDLPALKDKKVLILGYKNIRGGVSFYSDKVRKNQAWLKNELNKVVKEWRLVSFDCLSIEQLESKTNLNISDNDWQGLFQGDDYDVRDNKGNITCGTMYIDLPNKQVGRSSTAPLDKRQNFNYNESIEDLFKKSIIGW